VPGATITVGFVPQKPAQAQILPVDAAALVDHPEVKAALSALEGSEGELHAEIRRQYPDLKIGPAYANEEGLDRLGFSAGVSLPLWNRNRKAIAEAEAKRALTRLEAIDVWRALVCDAAKAYVKLRHLTEHPSIPSTERDEADGLADAGELAPLDYLTVREEILEQKISEAEWLRDIALAAEELEKFK
jgi:CRISPR system Cascade subunit CasA